MQQLRNCSRGDRREQSNQDLREPLDTRTPTGTAAPTSRYSPGARRASRLPDTLYVDSLIGPDTVTTLPEAAIAARRSVLP